MGHKAFEFIGAKVKLVDFSIGEKVGIFQESFLYDTVAEGNRRPALDFIQPIYDPSSTIEDLARGNVPRARINATNPILSLHAGLDHLLLKHVGNDNGVEVFEGELDYVIGTFMNDGNFEFFDRYREALKKVGFKIN